MRGTELVVDEDASDEDDAWYPHELAGLRAEHVDGRVLGEIVGLEHLPAHDMLVLREPDGAAHAVPFVRVDRAGGRRRRAVASCSTRRAGCSRPTPRTWSSPRRPSAATGTTTDVRIDVVSIFPEYLAPLDLSLVGKARTSGLLDLRVHDLRDWTTDRHRTVDDTPFGGGAGMVMRPDVWGAALDDVLDDGRAPAGADAVGGAVHAAAPPRRWPARRHLVLACGRYEGIDARVAEHYRSAGVTRHRVLDRRLRAQRRRGRRARRRRGRRAPAARRRRQPGVAGRGVARRGRAARVPRLHQAAGVGRASRSPRCCCPGTTRGSRAGAGTRRSSGPPRVGRT